MKLIKYDAALHALYQATRVDEVKDIRDKAVAMQVYATQARDKKLIAPATTIRVTAETRAGDILIEMKAEGLRRKPGQHQGKQQVYGNGVLKAPLPPKLKELGVTKEQVKRWVNLSIMKKTNPKKWQNRLDKMIRLAVAATEGDKAVIHEARAERQAEKHASRKKRIKALAGKIAALPDKKYAVILADPEWDYQTWSEKGKDRAAANHYTVSPTPVIKSRDVNKIAADDAVLFLWAIIPMLPQALEVMTAWGFTYVSHICWGKNKFGTGYWVRGQHELLLIGTRGDIPAPEQGKQSSSLVHAKVGKHSEKPKDFHRIIESYFPDLPKIELNCVGKPQPGWDGWGAEMEQAA